MFDQRGPLFHSCVNRFSGSIANICHQHFFPAGVEFSTRNTKGTAFGEVYPENSIDCVKFVG